MAKRKPKKNTESLGLERAHKLLELMLADKLIVCHLEACIGKQLIPEKDGGLKSIALRVAKRNQQFLEQIVEYCDLIWESIDVTEKTGEIFDDPKKAAIEKVGKEYRLRGKLLGERAEPETPEDDSARGGDDEFESDWEEEAAP